MLNLSMGFDKHLNRNIYVMFTIIIIIMCDTINQSHSEEIKIHLGTFIIVHLSIDNSISMKTVMIILT